MKRIVLASASPRRKKLFDMMGISVTVHPSDIEEKIDARLSHDKLARSLAEQKGKHVASDYSDAVIISADTIVVYEDSVLGKPQDRTEAASMLKKLSDSSHCVYSGVNMIELDRYGRPENSVSFFERTKVTFSALDDFEIDQYVESGSPLDKAGAYGIQDDFGSLFVKKIEGDYYNVVGFPINAFYQKLKLNFRELFTQIYFS